MNAGLLRCARRLRHVLYPGGGRGQSVYIALFGMTRLPLSLVASFRFLACPDPVIPTTPPVGGGRDQSPPFGLTPAESAPEDRRPHCLRFRLRQGYGGQALTARFLLRQGYGGQDALRLMGASSVMGGPLWLHTRGLVTAAGWSSRWGWCRGWRRGRARVLPRVAPPLPDSGRRRWFPGRGPPPSHTTGQGQRVGIDDQSLPQGGNCSPEVDPQRIAAGEQAVARGRTDRGGAVGVGESAARGGETVHVRGFDLGRAVAAEIAVAEVIGQDQDNVGGGVRRRWR